MKDIRLSGNMPTPKRFIEESLGFDKIIGDLPLHRFIPMPTGFRWLDDTFSGGIYPGNLFMVLGKQSVGKTTFVLEIMRNIAKWAKKEKHPIFPVFFSYEHKVWDLYTRLLCLESYYIDSKDPLMYSDIMGAVRTVKEIENIDLENVSEIRPTAFLDSFLSKLPIIAKKAHLEIMSYADQFFLYGASRRHTSIDHVEQIIKSIHGDNERTVLPIIDYLQAMSIPQKLMGVQYSNSDTVKDMSVSYTLQAAKDITKDHNIPVIVVASTDKDALKSPNPVHIEDADGQSAIPFTIDGGIVLNRDSGKEAKNGTSEKTIRIAVEKNRNLGNSEIEFRHVLYGKSFHINPEGEEISFDESYQAARTGNKQKE